MDPVWIAVAFVFGFGMRMVRLPPLVGFLAAGFALKGFGVEGGATLDQVADLGVYLLLFGIGLKLDLKGLLRPEVWGVASAHMLVTTVVFGLGVFVVGLAGAGLLGGLGVAQAALIGFALSFSSTVFAVKVQEESGEVSALHARVAIGILIMQDLFAIVFLTASTGKVPSPWALGLLALPLLRPPLMWIMSRSGHGELLVLLGILLVFGATRLFELVSMKPDLGALAIGVLVGSHPKAGELSKALMGFKDLFLVGFFLSIGLKGAPSLEAVGIALVLAVVMPVKVALFYVLLAKFRLRARTALLSSLSLANYSEFGLIVGAVGATAGWITDEWLVIIAVALSMTFLVAAPLNTHAREIYERFADRLRRHETPQRIPGDELIDPGAATIVIFGMGRVGRGAYDELRDLRGDVVIGVDRNPESVRENRDAGRTVVLGDATDLDFHLRVEKRGQTEIVVLTMSNHRENMEAARILRATGFANTIAATARYPDHLAELEQAGVRAAFDLYREAGAGLAEHVVAATKGA
ncbi:MAG: cation:proton antiporter [Planctomycetes bacterium]|nr:cation:proton antiporter [Planctomycetota bacterium]